ncbi:MAG: sulfotransferase, partial [Planctomycetota bacterium]
MSRPRFLFISGCNRSGTTWVGQLVDHHPHARVESEVGYVRPRKPWIARDVIERWATSVPAGSYWRGWDIDRVLRVALRGAIESVWLDTMKPGPHVRIIGDKAPLVYGEAAEQAHALFPDSLYIDVVRDGRDVAVSRVFKALQQDKASQWHPDQEKHDRARGWYIAGERRGEAPSLLTVDSVRALARTWTEAIDNGERAASLWGDAFLRVRYEDLLDETREHTARIYRHLD